MLLNDMSIIEKFPIGTVIMPICQGGKLNQYGKRKLYWFRSYEEFFLGLKK